MNFIWTILNKGRASDTTKPYARKTDDHIQEIPFNVSQTVNSMVTGTPDSYRYFLIERVVQAALKSPYGDQLTELDEFNTYQYLVDVASTISVTNATDLNVTPTPKGTKTYPVVTYAMTLDVSAESLTVVSEYGTAMHMLAMTNQLSKIIPLSDTMEIRVQGDVSAQLDGSVITLYDSLHPVFDLPALMTGINIPEWYDADMRHVYLHGTTVEKLAAVLINAAKGVIDG